MLKKIMLISLLSLFIFVYIAPVNAQYEIEEPPFKIKKGEQKKHTSEKVVELKEDKNGTLKGKVVSGDKGISGAVILLNNGSKAVTDLNGEYTISNLTPGRYTVTISAPSYNTATADITIVAGVEKRVLAVLSPDFMPATHEQFVPKNSRSSRAKSTRRYSSKRVEKGFITVRASTYVDTFDMDGDRPGIWWVKSIKVEQLGAGMGHWNDTWPNPGRRDISARTRELFCSGATVGDDYRIEVVWQKVLSDETKRRTWTETLKDRDAVYEYSL